MQSQSHVANLSSTASGVVEDRSTGSEHDQVVDHSPSASGVVGDGSTGPKKFAVIPAHQIHVDGFSEGLLLRDQDRPMIVNPYSRLVPCADAGSTSVDVVNPLKLPGCDILPTPPLGMIGSPQGVIEGLFPSLGRAREVCGDILQASYEYGGLAHYFMHRYIDHIASEDPLTEVPRLGFDDDMRNFGIMYAMILWDKTCRDTVLGTSNPAAVPKPHRISVEMLPHHPIIRPPVWIVKSTGPNKLRRLTNYLDEDAYLNLIQWRSRDALRFRFSGLFGVEALHHPPLQPSNYSDIPPPPLPPRFLSSAMLVLWLCRMMMMKSAKGVIRQKMDESDEAFEARKAEAEGKSAAEKDAAAKKRIKLSRREKKPFDVFLTTMWRTANDATDEKDDDRLRVEENSRGEAEVPRRAEENAQMRVEEHSQGDAEAPRREEGAQILPPENDHRAEGACQSAEENRQPTEEENHRPTEEENYQSMDRGNHRPVEEENHRPTEEENHRSIEEENHRPTEEENRRSADKDAPVGDDEKDHNDDSATKPQMSLRKWLWVITPWLTHKSHHKVHRITTHRRSFTLPDVVSPGSPSEDIFVQGSKSHPPSPSAPYSHQVSHPRHELSPPQPRTRSRSLSPSAQTGTRGASVALSKNLLGLLGDILVHMSCSEHGSHDLQPRSRNLSPRSRDLSPHSHDLHPRFRDNTSRSRDHPPHSHGLPSHSRDLPRSRDLPHSRDLPRSHDLPLRSHDLPRDTQSDRPGPSIPRTSQSRQPPTGPRGFRMRSEVAVDNDWRARTVGSSRGPSGMMGSRDMPWAAPEGASPSNFDGSSRDGRRRGPDVRVHQRPPAPISSGLAASHSLVPMTPSPVTFLNPAANAVAVDTWYVIRGVTR
ncbi:hypothetical protein BS47DRAFT_1396448 [Hydnum rufescens UP504]|uniref:Uncharacterized protein n=1 Tax=Hydnum rufescens UP504 TaxID=1448309 RepID=A0A9P6AQ01_9AGAM|nr:hypothetical protein BS47DRAFT_1396448 [Hydnum rufescens UP504]